MNQMSTSIRAAFVALALAAWAGAAVAKERIFSPIAGAGQEIRYSDGQAVLVTGNADGNIAASLVPVDKKSVFLRLWIENASEQQFNFSETSVTASAAGAPLRVFTYADLVKEQKRREMWGAIAAGLAAGANSYAASNAGYSNYSGSYSGRTNATVYGSGGTVYGSSNTYGRYYGTSYNAGVAYLAQANAAAQNQAMFDRFQATAYAAKQTLQDRALKANTLTPGQHVFGDIKVQLPRAGEMELNILVGSQMIALRFHEGAPVVDTTPRPVAASVPAIAPPPAPIAREELPPPAPLPMTAMQPPIANGQTASALSHPSGPAARAELGKIGCEDEFQLVSSNAGHTIFEATCRNGKRQLMECYGLGCRPLN